MTVTVNDVLLGAYYRRGENSIPNDTNEQARAISFIGHGYRDLIRQNKFWFTIATSSDTSVADQNEYDLPSDFREMIELRYNNNLVYPQSLTTSSHVYRYPPMFSPYPISSLSTNWYYIQNTKYYLVPTPTVGGETISLKYYKWPTTTFSSLTDEILIPEQYQDALSAYVFGRMAQMEGERGDAQDGFQEYNDIVGQMNQENMSRQLVMSSETGL